MSGSSGLAEEFEESGGDYDLYLADLSQRLDLEEKAGRFVCNIRGINPDEWLVYKSAEHRAVVIGEPSQPCGCIPGPNSPILIQKWQVCGHEVQAILAAIGF